MTEAEWNACVEPWRMLNFLEGKVSDRKLRLFAAACCRRIWHLIDAEDSRHAVTAAEQFADGQISESERAEREHNVDAAYSSANAAAWCTITLRQGFAERCAFAARQAVAAGLYRGEWGDEALAPPAERIAQIAFVRDIFGNHFRPTIVEPVWRTANVISIAEAIYAERGFDRLPILADALEDAGCTAAEVLKHCRGPGPHVRGCWVVDSLLGKS